MKILNLIGQTFGRLLVIEKAQSPIASDRLIGKWLCKCMCGNEKLANSSNLKRGRTKSCGCLVGDTNKAVRLANPDNFKKHGNASRQKRTPEYVCWLSMRQRCSDKNHKHYDRYGGRGIVVCAEWINDFSCFLKDMGKKPFPKYSIDRIDCNGNYEPKNCRWATHSEQQNNKTNNSMVVVNGLPLSAIEASRLLNIPYSTLRYRIAKFKQGLIPESEITLRR